MESFLENFPEGAQRWGWSWLSNVVHIQWPLRTSWNAVISGRPSNLPEVSVLLNSCPSMGMGSAPYTSFTSNPTFVAGSSLAYVSSDSHQYCYNVRTIIRGKLVPGYKNDVFTEVYFSIGKRFIINWKKPSNCSIAAQTTCCHCPGIAGTSWNRLYVQFLLLPMANFSLPPTAEI